MGKKEIVIVVNFPFGFYYFSWKLTQWTEKVIFVYFRYSFLSFSDILKGTNIGNCLIYYDIPKRPEEGYMPFEKKTNVLLLNINNVNLGYHQTKKYSSKWYVTITDISNLGEFE
jgi:hypothetical protein